MQQEHDHNENNDDYERAEFQVLSDIGPDKVTAIDRVLIHIAMEKAKV